MWLIVAAFVFLQTVITGLDNVLMFTGVSILTGLLPCGPEPAPSLNDAALKVYPFLKRCKNCQSGTDS